MNSSIKNVFFAIFSAEDLSSASLKYSSLKVKIADGSIPINGVVSEIKSLKIITFLFANSFACFSIHCNLTLLKV
jgi:hypothetical protein